VKLAVAGIVAALLVAGCGGTRTVTKTVTIMSDPIGKSGAGPPFEQVEYGFIKSLKRQGNAFVLKFDPALLVSGVTANVAQADDQGTTCAPSACPPVANDNYVINEGHRPLTYLVPAKALVSVLATGVAGTPITVAQLAGIVNGENPLGHPLWEGLDTGVWIRVRIDTVRSIDQQYHP
jgi:hypothetical protein